MCSKYLAGGYIGYDKEGSPVYVDLVGQLDMRGLMRSAKKSDLLKTLLWRMEKLMVMLREQSIKVLDPYYQVFLDIGCMKKIMNYFSFNHFMKLKQPLVFVPAEPSHRHIYYDR